MKKSEKAFTAVVSYGVVFAIGLVFWYFVVKGVIHVISGS